MQDENTNNEMYVTDLEEALKSSQGSDHAQLLGEKLEDLSAQMRRKSEEPQTEADYQRIQTVINGITAAQDVLRKFPVQS
ncbi:Type III secretion system, E component of needle [Pseudovibrio denitrificans]|uniref:Type III secretion system, E component of needle n=1 Tax=Pseudovibrio denitrificans TaxID=258256 RepID=A0A1I7BK32_9HYPH|nr:EscE/YscE/SsaE family type III secretion system needle protein co-chaperone [Pseudovibrio denitrificans]SFT87533.1 Type III secretion system, E component of needle [Pseudovibrio denitrificans]